MFFLFLLLVLSLFLCFKWLFWRAIQIKSNIFKWIIMPRYYSALLFTLCFMASSLTGILKREIKAYMNYYTSVQYVSVIQRSPKWQQKTPDDSYEEMCTSYWSASPVLMMIESMIFRIRKCVDGQHLSCFVKYTNKAAHHMEKKDDNIHNSSSTLISLIFMSP